MNSKNEYDETISNSKEESMKKAMLILEQNILENENNKEKIKRPEINTKKIVLNLLIVTVLEIVFLIISILCLKKYIIVSFIMLGLLVITIILTSKKNIINLILLYQKYAPEKIRRSCLFEPTCSEYMILAIKKYGIIKGIYKGIKRLLRCHSPNGGVDYP
jgi:putative membrane protein insertion efficiency factor